MAQIVQREDGKIKRIERMIWTNEFGEEFVRVYGWWYELGVELERIQPERR